MVVVIIVPAVSLARVIGEVALMGTRVGGGTSWWARRPAGWSTSSSQEWTIPITRRRTASTMPITWVFVPTIIVIPMRIVSAIGLTAPTTTLSALALIVPSVSLTPARHFGRLVTVEVRHYVLLAT